LGLTPRRWPSKVGELTPEKSLGMLTFDAPPSPAGAIPGGEFSQRHPTGHYFAGLVIYSICHWTSMVS